MPLQTMQTRANAIWCRGVGLHSTIGCRQLQGFNLIGTISSTNSSSNGINITSAGMGPNNA